MTTFIKLLCLLVVWGSGFTVGYIKYERVVCPQRIQKAPITMPVQPRNWDQDA